MVVRGRTALLLVLVSVVVTSLVTSAFVSEDPWLNDIRSFFGREPVFGKSDKDVEAGFEKLEKTYHILKKQYLYDVDGEKLVDGAIRGMVESLDDPHSTYMDPKTAKQFLSQLQSSFEGIGAEVTMKDGKVTIVSPIKGSPAEKAGLRPNDQLLSVDGKKLEGLSLSEAVAKIRGPKGTKVKLEVLRPGSSEPMEVTVTRDTIAIETVRAGMIDGAIGKIQLTNFAESTAEDFTEKLKSLENKGMKGLIIDVRGNPGGYLNAVVDIGNQLIPDEKPILWTEDRNGKKEATRSTLKQKKPYPIVVLIDKGSASASEILAAALQESGGYLVVGESSFGKGTVQRSTDFPDKSNIKYTIAKWLTPDQNWIEKKGVQPDVVVKYPPYYHAPVPTGEKVWKPDDYSEEIRGTQLILKELGYKPGRTDGYFSKQTKQALQAFQQDNGLKVTGVLDEPTAVRLQEKVMALFQDEDRDRQLKRAIEELQKQM